MENQITEVVSKEALEQLDLLNEKLETAIKNQQILNALISKQKELLS